ncbi:RNA polymerase-associated protein RapA [Paraglaciecola agarilytica]|uniref:RNA polymerase-associated protein RapA n=1 Tax=Paraglaciecola chathamensis TaxID=368405 RepID=UPI001C09E65D|nr:RNA polymerase-associated protein RapA [Paraglaciecola agarilytica]MBU3016813.1 RNA polymerase-associated protein RapA [Paraglaciecola agarilytica]
MAQKHSFALGQRWLSDTQTELGLGTVVSVDNRAVSLLFPATGDSRAYAKQSAPLTRITFGEGDNITSHEGWEMKITSVSEHNDMLTYTGVRHDTEEDVVLKETFIDHHFQLNQPEQRLFAGQFDHPKWFDLREQCLNHQYSHSTSSLLGFVGARVDLIPHQLHIAAEVGRRFAPRVLLADEVGLGKTIEAALIIHQQLLTARAERVLIVVPSSLVHQWLVEMLRRVNLAFSIFDEERCSAMSGESGNPFESEQLVICSLDFLTHNSRYYELAMQAPWDLMVVDEAHHLIWSEGQPSQEYQVVQGLAQVTKGVLLLTATPDQLGHESHFARLRLLDPARFHDYQSFVKEEQQYSTLAQAISPLMSGETLSPENITAIESFAKDEDLGDINGMSTRQKTQLLHNLLDRHGTGRLLFRNSRAGVSGFPDRKLFSYSLEQPEEYIAAQDEDPTNLTLHLTPERNPDMVNSWFNIDPRVDWFIDKLQELKGEKVLTICANAATALQLAEVLRVKAGTRATVFHEGMGIVERDKAANYFAQTEEGAQVLICSEIGSEGRNFQFAHHLVLFDLPQVPDLLEQRIGRLDRIGQTHDVCIHVPYFDMSAQQVLLDWYHQGLNAFEQTCPTGMTVYEETQELLHSCLMFPTDFAASENLINQTASLHRQLKERLEQGRDKLLELNSSGKGKVEKLQKEILGAEDSPTLELFMTRLFDTLGLAQEDKDESCYILRPTETMVATLPGLDEEGMTITYERTTATRLEHVNFFSWDHPMVQHAMETVTTEITGKSSVALGEDKSLPAGAYWLECLFVLSGKAEKSLQLDRFLPPTPIKICVDTTNSVVEKQFTKLDKVRGKMGNQLIKALTPQLTKALVVAQNQGEQDAEKVRKQCQKQMKSLLGGELKRMQSLQKVNPSIRDEEIEHLQQQIDDLKQVISEARVNLEAIRLIVNNP